MENNISKHSLSPVAIFCYNRPFHLQRLIDSLLDNPLAIYTDLYFFSDGSKGDEDKDSVLEVRKYLSSIKGFKSINLECRTQNIGLANNVISGVSKVLDAFGRIIVLEDDLLVSSDFLFFMNNSLEFYKGNLSIHSVSAFKFSFQLPQSYDLDVYLLPRDCSLGWGTWKDRWDKVNWDMNYFPNFISNKQLRKKLEEGGENLTLILLKQYLGMYKSWAIRWDFDRFTRNMYCLYPVYPKVINMGNDGSGTNDSKFIRNNTILSERAVQLIYNVPVNTDIIEQARLVFKLSIVKKIYFFLLLLRYRIEKLWS